MFDRLIQSTTIPVLEQVVGFAQARHSVLAGNIANLDTPGYRARDLSVTEFQSRLREAIASRAHPGFGPSPGELAIRGSKQVAEPGRVPRTILRHDDADVSMEHEVTEMAKNQLQHNIALSILRSQMQLLQVAIAERA